MRYRNYRWPGDRYIRIHVGREEHLATLRNVNSAGLCVICKDSHLSPGDRPRFTVLGLDIVGRVIWIRSGRVGVKFDDPITEAQLSFFRNIPVSLRAGHWPSVARKKI